ncbi:MAG: hypothetical protein ACLFUJ_11230 [Phycisphaerae bacterium]
MIDGDNQPEPPARCTSTLRFALADPLVASQVVGLNNVSQVASSITAVDKPLPGREIVERAWTVWKKQLAD